MRVVLRLHFLLTENAMKKNIVPTAIVVGGIQLFFRQSMLTLKLLSRFIPQK